VIVIDTEKKIYKNCDDLADILINKNNMYGSSFLKTLNKYGFNIVLARLEDKLERLRNLLEKQKTIILDKNNKSFNLDFEKRIKDTLFDIAGYSILFKTCLEVNEKGDSNVKNGV